MRERERESRERDGEKQTEERGRSGWCEGVQARALWAQVYRQES